MVAAAVGLGGCAAYIPTEKAPPEPLGPSFSMLQTSLKDGGEQLTFFVHSTDENGYLKVCGMYLLAADQTTQETVERALGEHYSNIELVGSDQSKRVRLHLDFIVGYRIDKDAPLGKLSELRANPAAFAQSMRRIGVVTRTAGCARTTEPWQEAFARAPLKLHLVKTAYTTIYMPVHGGIPR